MAAFATLFFLAAAVMTSSLFARPARACSCLMPSLDEAVRTADLVLSGVVTGVRLAHPAEFAGEALTVVDLTVQKTWKGRPAQTATLHTRRNLASCDGFEFVVGQRYVVFATRNDPDVTRQYGLARDVVTYGVKLCGGTVAYPTANARERELDLARPPAR